MVRAGDKRAGSRGEDTFRDLRSYHDGRYSTLDTNLSQRHKPHMNVIDLSVKYTIVAMLYGA